MIVGPYCRSDLWFQCCLRGTLRWSCYGLICLRRCSTLWRAAAISRAVSGWRAQRAAVIIGMMEASVGRAAVIVVVVVSRRRPATVSVLFPRWGFSLPIVRAAVVVIATMISWWRAVDVLVLPSGGSRPLPITREASGWRAASWRKPVAVLVLPSGWRISTSVAVLTSTGCLTEWRPRSLPAVWIVPQFVRLVFGIVKQSRYIPNKLLFEFLYTFSWSLWPRIRCSALQKLVYMIPDITKGVALRTRAVSELVGSVSE